MYDISLVIPVKDEEPNIEELTSRISNAVKKIRLSYEVVFVTDINKDNTLGVIKEINRRNNNVKAIKLSNRFGHHVAVLAGLTHTSGNAIVIMDGDLQDYPEDIPLLYEEYKKGFDVVYGIKKKKNDSIINNVFSKTFLSLLGRVSDYDLDYNTSMYRIISRRTAIELLKFKEIDPSFTGIMSLIGFPTSKVLVTSGKRAKGATKYGFWQRLNFAFNFLFSFSTKPLKISSIIGFLISLMSFCYMLQIIFFKIFFNVSVLGWPTIVSLITFLGGIQLFFLGIIGEYLARVFIETKRRPLFIIEEKIGI